MFVQNLNSEQQSALLFLAKKIIMADGNLDDNQLAMLSILKQQVNEGVVEKELDELSSIFDTKIAKYSLLLELLGITLADDVYHPEEKKLILKYAKALNVSEEQLKLLEDWVMKQLALSKEIEKILN